MNDDIRVWIRKRKLKKKCRCRGPCRCKEKSSYHLRWLDPATGGWLSKRAGTDRKVAEREAAVLEQQLQDGTFQSIRRIDWAGFVEEHVAHITGEANAREAKRVLEEFGRVRNLADLRRVTFADVEAYVDHLRNKGNGVATRNKCLRYVRAAINLAVYRGYLTQSPVKRWQFEKQKKTKKHRILTVDEETKLLASAEKLYGFKMVTFIRFLLETWARLEEAAGLSWNDVDFDGGFVTFLDTKSKEDRYVPFDEGSDLVDDLQRLKVQTLKDGGPFAGYGKPMQKAWTRLVKAAGIPHITRHDLRRTGVTRALLANMPPVAVKEMAGHASLATTMMYYVEVDQKELKAALTRCRQAVAG